MTDQREMGARRRAEVALAGLDIKDQEIRDQAIDNIEQILAWVMNRNAKAAA